MRPSVTPAPGLPQGRRPARCPPVLPGKDLRARRIRPSALPGVLGGSSELPRPGLDVPTALARPLTAKTQRRGAARTSALSGNLVNVRGSPGDSVLSALLSLYSVQAGRGDDTLWP